MDNSDEVFWRRRTDSLTYRASVKTSSGDGSKLNDFKLFDTREIDKISCDLSEGVWLPNDENPMVSFTWDNEVIIDYVIIYGSILGNGYEGNVEIRLDGGSLHGLYSINEKPACIELDTPGRTKTLSILFPSGFVNRNGIAEIEIFESKSVTCKADDSIFIHKRNETGSMCLAIDRIVPFIDHLWLKMMRIRSYIINYSILFKSGGLKAVIHKIKNRL